MRCPSCHTELSDNATRCPSCGRERKDQVVLDPELVPGPGDPRFGSGPSGPSDASGQDFFRVFYSSFPRQDLLGCLPFLIPFVLALGILFSYGLLAAIGFLVFLTIGRVATLLLSLRLLAAGKIIPPWPLHILTWAVSWLLVAWLSGNLT